jgi:acetyl esterase/lipase
MQALLVLALWGQMMPGPVPTNKDDYPNLTVYEAPAAKRNGCAVVICPGGGYGALAMDHEGKQVAEFMNQQGVTAFVLKYRIVKKDSLAGPIAPAPMLDVQRAIRIVRANAASYKIDPKRIGIFGFSAGGHLASTAATHFDAGDAKATDPIEKQSSRPDFAILAYPVISMEPGVTHGGSKNNLIGKEADAKQVEFYSNDKQVTKETPPVFLMHTAEDKTVLIENAKRFEAACKKNNVPIETAYYEEGAHGIGLASKSKLPVHEWPTKLVAWMTAQKLLEAAK